MATKKSQIHFRPWVGAKYENGIKGKRLLVLGESHYSDADDPDLTRTVMKRLFEYKLGACGHESWMKTFTTFERAVAGRALSGEESIAFWNSAIFYNFIQEPLPHRGCRPTARQFVESSNAFDEVLNEYEPDLVIAWGVTLFDKVSPHDGRGTLSMMSDTADVYTYEYTLRSGKTCRTMRMPHPASYGYVWKQWHEAIARFMA